MCGEEDTSRGYPRKAPRFGRFYALIQVPLDVELSARAFLAPRRLSGARDPDRGKGRYCWSSSSTNRTVCVSTAKLSSSASVLAGLRFAIRSEEPSCRER